MKWYEGSAPLGQNVEYFFKWTAISCFIGITVGLAGTAFGFCVVWAADIWQNHHWTLFLMPLAGLLIAGLYKLCHEEKNGGTNTVLASISAHADITMATAPLIFVTTILSHLVSASVGREGAALQMGGGLGNMVGKALKLDERDKKVAVMCGMSACFAALFGTPLAAGIFSLEVISVGVMYYAALVPCLFSAFIGAGIAKALGLGGEHFVIGAVPEFGLPGAGLSVVLGMLCSAVGILLCVGLHRMGHLFQKLFPGAFLRVLAGSAVFIALTLIFNDRLYNGSGLELIERCFAGERVPLYAFLLKIVFTAVALGAGFKGGEIVPTLCVGAAFGYAMSELLGEPSGICIAVCMVCVFVSVTNCPMASVFLAFELFGYEAMPYYALSIAICFTLSGYYSLYSTQRFIYSKTRTEYINRHTNE